MAAPSAAITSKGVLKQLLGYTGPATRQTHLHKQQQSHYNLVEIDMPDDYIQVSINDRSVSLHLTACSCSHALCSRDANSTVSAPKVIQHLPQS